MALLKPEPKQTRRHLSLNAAFRLLLELFVIFIGVYAAFALSEHEKRRDAAERRDQFSRALVREIEDITSNTRRVAREMPLMVARLDSLIAAGERPPLQPMIERLGCARGR